jgi:hypothetical protein
VPIKKRPKYADEGVLNLDDANGLKIAPFSALPLPEEAALTEELT